MKSLSSLFLVTAMLCMGTLPVLANHALNTSSSAMNQPLSLQCSAAKGNAFFTVPKEANFFPVYGDEAATPLLCATELFSLPGRRFMHKIVPARSSATLSVSGLPLGLTWNARRKLIEGMVDDPGVYSYTVRVSDGEQVREIPITLTVSDQLSQPVPFMAWISWNVVEGNISDKVIRQTADAMVSLGLRDAGYRYLVVDDLWHADQRHADGTPAADSVKFPLGMAPVVDYVHKQGLKFGIYSDAAEKTCAGAYGSLGYESIDAQQYARWGVDLLKYDYCDAPEDVNTAFRRYKTMGDALRSSGREILFYMCEWGVRQPWKWGAKTGASVWRATYDARDCWQGKPGGTGVAQSVEIMKDLWPYAGVNRFNDADMMSVGIHGKGKSSSDLCATGPGMTQDEYRTQFSLWCMWSSPLILSLDLRRPLSEEDRAIITNRELIALNQDSLGQQAEFVGKEGAMYYFMKDLSDGSVAISATNMGDNPAEVVFDFSKFSALDARRTYYIRDLWAHKNVGKAKRVYRTQVKSHATVVFRFSLRP